MLSIVIPVLNEEIQLRRILPSLLVKGVREVIVVDGGSVDATREVAEHLGARVMRSLPGRGVQMSLGARAAQAEFILFLHADTLPPQGFVGEIVRLLGLSGVTVGAFRLGIDLRGATLRLVEAVANFRCKLFRSPYGDQGIFVRKEVLAAVGGVPQIPLLEDVGMVRRLKEEGQVTLSHLTVKTSGRSWQVYGVLRTTTANFSTCMGYFLGIQPARLAAWRRKLLPPQVNPTPAP